MDSLSLEMRREILRHLDLNDLARCGRVSRAVREGADEVLSTIRCIYDKSTRAYDYSPVPHESPYTFAWLNSTPKITMFGAEFSQPNMRSFLQFITTKCHRISSLVATKYSVCLEDIAALAPRLNYFSLFEIKKRSGGTGTIDAKTMAANFTNLQCYNVINNEDNNGRERCHHVVAREYCLLGSHQFAQCDEFCRKHEPCHKIIKYRALKSLRSMIGDYLPLSLYELHPSSFNSLQVLSVEGSIFVPDNSPHFPNLLVAEILSEENLSGMIRLLHSSPKLIAVRLHGVVDQESFSAIDLLLSACSALQLFYYDPSADSDVGDVAVHSLDLTRLKSIRSFTWHCGDIPLKLTLPPHCHQIVCDDETISFKIDARAYSFHPLVLSFSMMSTFHHPLEVVISDDSYEQFVMGPLMRLCPQISLTLSFESEADCLNMMVFILPKALKLTNVNEITLVSRDKKEIIYKSNLETFFDRLESYPDRSFLITLRGKISCNLRSVIKAQLNRKFIISGDNSKSPRETIVKIPSLSNVSPPTNTE